jgi:hypothetical protein
MSRLSRQCGILNISQPYRPLRTVTGIAFFTLLSEVNLRTKLRMNYFVSEAVEGGHLNSFLH